MLRGFEEAGLLGGSQPGVYAYVEGFCYQDTGGAPRYDLEAESLPEDELEDWIWRRGKHVPRPAKKPYGGIRLLFAQSMSGSAQGIPSALFKAKALDGLHLPKCSFHSFQQAPGVLSVHTEPEHAPKSACARLGLLFRTPQKWECSIGMFAISHAFDTRITTALSLGYAFDLDTFETKRPSTFDKFVGQLNDSRGCWTHPMMLPCMFLITHALRVELYLRDTIGPEVVAIKDYIGITRAGTSQREYLGLSVDHSKVSQRKLFMNGRLHRGNAKRLTESINDLSTWINFTKRSPKWDIQCADFLLNLMDSDQRLHDADGQSAKHLQETLHYVRNQCEASLDVAESSAAQMQLQLDILYASIAQDDGQTSARIAAAAGRDSTSMKIIALITAAYLPGTFVATLFSMGMFDWRSSNTEGSSSRASPDLWIYWAVTVPLTLVTLSGWAIWWKFEMSRLDRDVQNASQGRTTERLGGHSRLSRQL